MSYIPNCRTDEIYNEKYLDKEDYSEVRGFDWCAEEVVDNFFDNLEVYELDESSYIGHILREEIPESMKEEYEMQYRFGDRPPEKREVKTWADLIRSKLLDWIEMKRDELITSMIDNYEWDEFDARKADVDAREAERARGNV